ncbi:MAG TPA: hypothetical protein VLR26_11560 [Frankiaceae bacterium]|nr:hypothetical protein [Frankiaceae bacterium]
MTTHTPTAPANRQDNGAYGTDIQHSHARQSTETKASFKTTELIAYVVAVVGVLVASLLVKTTEGHADYFRADRAWFYVVLLTIGYLGSRGLAKSGSRDNYDA